VTAAGDRFGPGERRALAVVTGRYRHESLPDLVSPAMDAQAAQQVLGNPELGRFDPVEVLADVDSRLVMEGVYDFFSAAEDADFLFAYFSGHGRKDGDTGRLYLATIDTDPDRLPLTALSTEFLRELVDGCRAQRVVMVLDCCYAGAFGGEPRQRQNRERVVVLSASAVQQAHEGELTPGEARPSAFARAFFDGIRSGLADSDDNGWITIREAFDYTVARLRDLGTGQNPQMRAGVAGDLVLSRAPVLPGSLPAEISSLVRSSLPGARQVAVDELTRWLFSGDEVRAGSAEHALAALRADPDERVAQSASRVLAQRYPAQRPAGTVQLINPPADGGDPLWFRRAVFYEVRVRTFADSNGDGIGDLPGLTSRLGYLQWLGVGCLLLTPIYESPLLDGYDASNLTGVHPELGTVADLMELVDAAHRHGIRVVVDLVLNHTSDQHPWFRASRADPDGRYGDFYVWAGTDDRYTDALTAERDGEQPHWTYDRLRKQYYWHRFAACQPDLNYDCPGVQDELLGVLRSWLDLGVDGCRLVTAPYLYERDGTLCEGLSETHTYLRRLRAEVDKHYPGRVLIAAADHWPADAAGYFGTAEDGPECSVVLYASLAPRIFLAMLRQSHAPLSTVLAEAAPVPAGCQWGLFLRNSDPMSLDLVTGDDREYLLREYAPSQRMRSADGIRRRLATLLDGNRAQLELCMALLFSLPGAPVLYYGDEIGMGDNLMLPGPAAVRTPMQWTSERVGGFSVAEQEQLTVPALLNAVYGYPATNVEGQSRQPTSLLQAVRRLIEIRRHSPALMAGSYAEVHSGNPAVYAYLRGEADERMLCVANFSRYPQAAALDLSGCAGGQLVEATGGARFAPIGADRYPLSLSGYGFFWFRLTEPGRAVPAAG
jgi:trehalose synthase